MENKKIAIVVYLEWTPPGVVNGKFHKGEDHLIQKMFFEFFDLWINNHPTVWCVAIPFVVLLMLWLGIWPAWLLGVINQAVSALFG